MQAFIGGAKVTLTDNELLGVGGEARVYRWRDRAVKVYHSAASQLVVAKLSDFPRGLPSEVVAPLELVKGADGATIGFAMRLVPQATEALRQRHTRL